MISISDIIQLALKIPDLFKWYKYKELHKIIQSLEDDEKHILSGLFGSHTQLQIYSAIKRSTGSELTPQQLGRKDDYRKNLIKKKLIINMKGGFILSEGAKYAISKGALIC